MLKRLSAVLFCLSIVFSSLTPALPALAAGRAASRRIVDSASLRTAIPRSMLAAPAIPIKKIGSTTSHAVLSALASDGGDRDESTEDAPDAASRAGAPFDGTQPGEPEAVVPEIPASAENDLTRRESLMAQWKIAADNLKLLLEKKRIVEANAMAADSHIILDPHNFTEHAKAAATARGQLINIELKIALRRKEIGVLRSRIEELNETIRLANSRPQGGAVLESLGADRQMNLEDLGAISAQTATAIPETPAPNLLKRFELKGFALSQADKDIKAVSRWTGEAIDLAKFGIKISLDEKGGVSAAHQEKVLNHDQLLQWLEIAAMADLKKLPAGFAPATATEKTIAEAGKELYSRGVPPHILNNSAELVLDRKGDGKTQFNLTPDLFFYSFRQGVPMATPTGVLLKRFVDWLENERAERKKKKDPKELRDLKALTRRELYELGFYLEKMVVPWAIKESGLKGKSDQPITNQILKRLFDKFVNGRLVIPTLPDLMPVDVNKPIFDLAAHLTERFAGLQQQLQAQIADKTSNLDALQDLAQAVRFAWTVLNPIDTGENGLRAITHRDGFSFLKHTQWQNSNYIIDLLPLGDVIKYLKVEALLKYIQDNNLKGLPMIIADKGLAAMIHADLLKNVVALDRDGREIPPEILVSLAEKKEKKKLLEDRKKRPRSGEDLEELGGEHLGPDGHATAIATFAALLAELVQSKVYTVDEPGFAGDKDLVPPGMPKEDDFTKDFSRSVTAATELAVKETGLPPIIFLSWTGPVNHDVERALLDVHKNFGAQFIGAAGNSGGFDGAQTPQYAVSKAFVTVGAVGQDGKASYTQGIGLTLQIDGNIDFRPDLATLGGGFVANNPLDPTPENEVSLKYNPSTGKWYLHSKGTSFAGPIYGTLGLNVLVALALGMVGDILKLRGLTDPDIATKKGELAPEIIQIAKPALSETARMIPGVSAIYLGNGDMRPADAWPKLKEGVIELLTPQQAAKTNKSSKPGKT